MQENSSYADFAITNGKILTMDETEPIVEAVAVKFGKILATGTNTEIKSLVNEITKVVDAKGRLVCPGFIDTHCHPSLGGEWMTRVNMRTPPNKSITDCLQKLKERVEITPKGEWIICGGYNMGKIWSEEGRHINRWDLDEIAPDNPVQVNSMGGHTGSIYNSYALKLAGIDRNTPDPEPPAVIARDPETREPSGLVSESAEELLNSLVPQLTPELRLKNLKRAFGKFLEWGVTTVTDVLVIPSDFRAYQDLLNEGQLPLRVSAMLAWEDVWTYQPFSTYIFGTGIQTNFGNDYLKVTGMKLVFDGAFTGRTAKMYEPYVGENVPEDSPKYKGLFHFPPEELKKRVKACHLAGIRPCIHAQGDHGIDEALNAIEDALQEKPMENHRIRLEHGGLTTPKQLKRIKELGVCISSSISFLGGDVSTNWVYWGMERMKWTYALKSFIDYGIIAGGNGDWPVTTGNPFVGIATAVTRKAVTGDILDASQCIPVMDAIRLYTTNAAYLEFEEDTRGCIKPGYLADFIILNQDITTISPDDIRNTKVDMTIVGGEIKYKREN